MHTAIALTLLLPPHRCLARAAMRSSRAQLKRQGSWGAVASGVDGRVDGVLRSLAAGSSTEYRADQWQFR